MSPVGATARSRQGGWLWVGLALILGAPSLRADGDANLGSTTQGQAALMGIFYDIKQSQDHVSTGIDPDGYSAVLDDFLSHGWDERVLDRYYRVSRPFYTTQIFIPLFGSDEVPHQFGVEPMVQPTRWFVHYKAQVSPPEAGTYRFVGYSDDVMVVAVNRKTVLSGSHPSTRMPRLNWVSSEPLGQRAANGQLTYGDWFDLRADEIVDLDVVTGDRPGGYYCAFLLVQEKGVNYATDQQGYPILPIFQVAPYKTPHFSEAPEFADGYPIWKCYQ